MLNPLICIVSEGNSSLEDWQRHLTQHGLQGVRSIRRTEALVLDDADAEEAADRREPSGGARALKVI